MRLTAFEAVQLWEWGEEAHPLDRALILLGALFPEWTRDQAADLPVGRRDALLIDVREALAGPRLDIVVSCPSCGDDLEFELDVGALRIDGDATEPGRLFELTAEPWTVSFRLPTTRDQLALQRCQHVAEARQRLLSRCLVDVRCDGVPQPASEVPQSVLTRLRERMEELDPQASLRIQVSCALCGHEWPVAFDPVPFVWQELTAQVRAVHREVHQLAEAYSWSEERILAMSPKRRQWYLEMLS